MGKLSIANIHATIGEYQRTYLYKLFWEGATYNDKSDSSLTSDKDFTDAIDVYNNKAVFPNRKTDAKKISISGEFFHIPTVDNSTRDVEFEFFGDEAMKAYNFFNKLKNMTGNEDNQAGIWGVAGKFNLGIAQISVDKNTITLYRRLIGTRVYGLDVDGNDKAGSDEMHLRVQLIWDRSELDESKVGKTLDGMQ